MPAIAELDGYGLRQLRADAFAGLTVAAVAVPQGMAYALLAGLPPRYGLYGAMVIAAVGALFDSSRQLINGPTNAVSVAVLSALAVVPEAQRLEAAMALAVLVGVVQLVIWALRLGDLTRFLSHAVISGFTVGAAVLLVLGQLPVLLGIPPGAPGGHDHVVARFWHGLTDGGAPHAWSAGLGLGTVAFVLGVRAISRRFGFRLPDLFLAVVGSAAIVAALDLEAAGVRTVGAIPQELPAFHVPHLSWPLVEHLSGSALAIALLGLLEALAMAKALARRAGQKLDVHQQCLSEGLANAVGGFFQCFPGSGSLTRSTLNLEAGAASQWSGVFSAATVGATIFAAAPLARFIPLPALAGILLVAAARMVDWPLLRYHLRATPFDARIVVLTAVSAVAISIEFCILIGAVASFALYVPRATRLVVDELVVTPSRTLRERVPADPTCSRLRIFDLEGELFFGSAPDLERHLEAIAAASTASRALILRLKRVRNADGMCLHLLDDFLVAQRARGLEVWLCGLRPDLEGPLRRVGVVARLGEARVIAEQPALWSGTLEAVRRAHMVLGDDRCPTCPLRAAPDDGMEGWIYVI